MSGLIQVPLPGALLLKFAGESLEVTLHTPPDAQGRAFLRSNLGHVSERRHDIITAVESETPPTTRDWHEIPMSPDPAQPGVYTLRLPLAEPGFFALKACLVPEGETTPLWPEGPDTRVKVEPAHAVCANTVYTAFTRQFGKALTEDPHAQNRETADALTAQGYTVIPPSGTFRGLIRQLDHILGEMRFHILQLLPVHPTPTTYGRMGTFGSPFASRDLMDVDPALAEFDTRTTPMDQFRELVDTVHARGARIFLDIPANHTGWASVLQERHPEWFKRDPSTSAFKSPGAWGIVWEDLVELDYAQPDLRDYMAEVFLFWCAFGIDGFRCDAGYMVPAEVWEYITAKVRLSFPDTVFFLEGLGGEISVTRKLITESGLDWAYSELFQTETRADFERYFPAASQLSRECGPLVHFAETHDNNRLAVRQVFRPVGHLYSRMRVALSALLSDTGAWGITCGVEYFATEKIDVHKTSSLNSDSAETLIPFIKQLNDLISTHPAFRPGSTVRLLSSDGNTLNIERTSPDGDASLLVHINLDTYEVDYENTSAPSHSQIPQFRNSAISQFPNSDTYNPIIEISLPRDFSRVVPVPP
ncbi:MAG: alpha-amylase family glycosyl hydrolase, partial [Kiritimatiellaeota bacterium]|nr:alpha-amylase family glycosyl hydrolase [Kiritimatiellota bacterium]